MQQVFIGNLAYQTTEDDLREHFSQFGEVEQVKIPTDRETKRSRGFGFITFGSKEGAEAALEANGHVLNGRPMRVSMAQETASDSRRGGGFGGGGFGGGGFGGGGRGNGGGARGNGGNGHGRGHWGSK